MNDREKIFDSIQKALAPLPARTPYPEWETDIAICRKHPEFETNWELFSYRLKAVNGIPLKGLYSLAAHLKRRRRDYWLLCTRALRCGNQLSGI